jgi:hypothetical protein
MDIEVWNESTGQSLFMRGPDYVTCPSKKPTAEDPACAPYRCSENKVDVAFGEKWRIKGFLRDLNGNIIKESGHLIHLYVGSCGKAEASYVSSANTNADGYYEFYFKDVSEPHYTQVIKLAKASPDPTFFVHNKEGDNEGYSAEVRVKASWIPITAIAALVSMAMAGLGIFVGLVTRKRLIRLGR